MLFGVGVAPVADGSLLGKGPIVTGGGEGPGGEGPFVYGGAGPAEYGGDGRGFWVVCGLSEVGGLGATYASRQ